MIVKNRFQLIEIDTVSGGVIFTAQVMLFGKLVKSV